MSAIMKAALVSWLVDNKCSLVRVDKPTADTNWFIVFECPNAVGGTYKNFGSGLTEEKALINAIERAGLLTLRFRILLLEFMVEHLANRAVPGLLRRIDDGCRA